MANFFTGFLTPAIAAVGQYQQATRGDDPPPKTETFSLGGNSILIIGAIILSYFLFRKRL